ncbi:DsbA family protein [Altererythrobacter sp. KTW20L]|uniref:thioredoxin domain-containing protein n=1 Tax=Altererythrobacter sp. KTW20L TaxID=2942210 RepID=UPI0020C189F3|nr:thioredoxin domain-containing protein [Altererythrobacter sp. KTW20L]MCL6250624.1 DsbA family protein [Altererythrobacter sp. KTW20L]
MKKALIAGLLLAVAPIAALSAQNWDATYTATTGGHLLGNPAAETKLISFVSYSCPHCANFETQSEGPLRLAYIQPGKVSVEVRNVIRNPIDLAAALAAECGPESRFWGNHRAILRDQPRWLGVATSATAAQQARWSSGTVGSRMKAIASDLGFYRLMEPRGYSVAQLDQCLTDEAEARRIAESARADNVRWTISGTPSFAINDTMQEGVHSWSALQGRLDAAIR